ncbi:type I methionyl aminopeptidase [Arthrobacter sp.]|uniref:type I methionyl aminopeptidase n=1 Tax=Arthrobacter sp. TaxID=1667 RepID=UPI002810DCA1|nr:type I methionyl aminopeptidase [Arthrobacter sp.]
MIEILTPRELEAARPAGQLVARVLQELKRRTQPGTNLLELDSWARAMIDEAQARSCYVDYAPSFGRGPFGKVICTSVNDAVLHGLPHDYALGQGDLLTLDFAVELGGWVADAAVSFVVGRPVNEQDQHLIDTTTAALSAGIAAAQPGNKIGDISYAIGTVLTGAGYEVNTEFGGHGVGSTMHQDPHISNIGRPGRGFTLRPGMLLAIEPWVMAGTKNLRIDADGWTLRSANGGRTAHSEHTVAITEDGPQILTATHQV